MENIQSTHNINTGLDIMNIDKMKRLLSDRRLDVVSEATGVHVNTIARIRDGVTENPSHRSFEAIAKYLEETNAL